MKIQSAGKFSTPSIEAQSTNVDPHHPETVAQPHCSYQNHKLALLPNQQTAAALLSQHPAR